MYSLGLGAILAHVTLYNQKIVSSLSKSKWLYLSLMGYLFLFFISSLFTCKWYLQVLDPFIFSCFAFLFILRASTNSFQKTTKRILENKLIIYCGKVSYGLYIFHLFIPELAYWLFPKIENFNRWHPTSKYILFFCYFFTTLLLAHLSWKYIEKPINNLKYKFPYLY